MKIHKGFKFKIYPTKEQESSLLQSGGKDRFLGNYGLGLNQDYSKVPFGYKVIK